MALFLLGIAAGQDDVRAADKESARMSAAATEVTKFRFGHEADRDFDRFPDGWSRRRGPDFPGYIEVELDLDVGRSEPGSLSITPDGGACAIYSDPIRIDRIHGHVFEGWVKTEGLRFDAARFTVSILDHRRHRISRHVSGAVTATSNGWVRLAVGPIKSTPEQHFLVIGCHLVGSQRHDLAGRVYFDDLWLGRLPELQLHSNFHSQFRRRDVPVEIRSKASGLEPGHEYNLKLELVAGEKTILSRDFSLGAPNLARAVNHPLLSISTSDRMPIYAATDRGSLEVTPVRLSAAADGRSNETGEILWKLDPLDYGYYEVRATLLDDGRPVLREMTSFAVMDLVEPVDHGDFGWSIDRPTKLGADELASAATQAGINWIKYPVWQQAVDDPIAAGRTAVLIDKLGSAGLRTVGTLNHPPRELRAKFAHNWKGASELFTLPSDVWLPSLEPVVARYSSRVRHWQVGGDNDTGFTGMKDFESMLEVLKSEFERVGREAKLIVPWEGGRPTAAITPQFPLVFSRNSTTLDSTSPTWDGPHAHWDVLTPLPRSEHSTAVRAADLIRRMITARTSGADLIFAADVFDKEHGLLRDDGAPTDLFLPWRTTALALREAEHLGSLTMSPGVRNEVFVGASGASIVLWSDEPVREIIYLGETAKSIDIFGLQRTIPKDSTGRQLLDIGPEPLIITGGSEAVARWRTSVRFENGRLQSQHGEQRDAIVGRNSLNQGVSGTVTLHLPREWESDRDRWEFSLGPGEAFRLPVGLSLPPNASLGTTPVELEFSVVGDRPYRFTVRRTLEVGFGDLHLLVTDRKLNDGLLEIEQKITNRTSPVEVLDFRCSLFVPGSQRQIRTVTKLGSGTDTKFYKLPDAEAHRGKELWIRAEQEGGRRVLNYRWLVGEDWE
ncbi:hypothetical protein [Stratiformator vulcanicus]|uniref:hypothetical protein n=1 Tax=Stratiformator vulcanicus TaxID=2527980 RepID=UPI0011A558CB|nr:hypothetical protein [Stratiformator vulcanicus]